MHAYRIEKSGDINKLVAREEEVPKLGPYDVLIRVRAVSLNLRDLMILNGAYPVPLKLGVIPVSDGAGEVVEIGDSVRRVAVGDRVSSIYFVRWINGPLIPENALYQPGCTLDGMLTEYAVLNEEALLLIPSHLSFEEGATLPCAALTAWNALTSGRPVLPGETVLTLGTGGVGLFTVQLAKLFGARVIVLTSRVEKIDRVKALGADEAINYSEHIDWDHVVRQYTDGRGVDHIVETVGPDTLEKSIKSLAPYGEIALLRGGTGEPKIDLRVLMSGLVTLRTVFVGSRAMFMAMNRAIELHKVHPVIDRIFPFNEAVEAYRYVEPRRHFGKVVISL